ncbi:hypothetical protein P153DRAFT_286938 [Dothidotthia symphoricarpi CBS 119687]|uniref:Uncharacterized protein n=1 Tax=Dothidotthia symphoricarpi CBS 119687 TaxID=1392245 RepID=A0A6A6AIY8_9PLEO|nr:uncharacterized protein P153DRAFT_286938 [Dothidotthia symphoricarpi CBS 119687]KAF2130877.1 hypothetical protein P153DRAFT_286938 [Dothidotthia symphoricarpi CBS 119687]
MADDRRPLVHGLSDYPETAEHTPASPSLGFTNKFPSLSFAHIAPPTTPPTPSRPTYARLQSDAPVERRTPSTVVEEDEEDDIADSFRRQDSGGLGIAASNSPVASIRRASLARRPVASSLKSPSTASPPGTADPFLGRFPHDSAEATPDLTRERFSPNGGYEEFRRGLPNHAVRSLTAAGHNYEQPLHSSARKPGAPSAEPAYEHTFHPSHECQTTRDFYNSKVSWLNVSIIVICLFSTIFSGIFLVLALKAPRYGRRIRSQGHFKPSDAILLTSVLAKAIELSFVTSFVAFLGQVLSRRAFMKEDGRGVTLSELSMWRWVVQPGTLITHWEAFFYAGTSVLGILSLLSAVVATLYSSAAAAVVQPVLRDGGDWTPMIMAGSIRSDFANIDYVKAMCETPIRTDKEYSGATCVQIEHAGQGYYNYQRYLAGWDVAASNGNGSSDQRERPPGFGLLYDNTTVTAQWINIVNTTEISKQHGRVINNVSLAMPHSGVFAAAHDQRNGILQPEELNSEGTYSLRASVPSPVLNALCVNMNKTELDPIVYDSWNDELVNITTWKDGFLMDNATTTNKTVVDDIFGWNDVDRVDYPPVFSRFPLPFNTVMNHTSYPWGRAAIYFLGQGGLADDGTNGTGTFALCRLQMNLSPECQTRYNVSGASGSMESLCEDRAGSMQYSERNPDAQWILGVRNWRDIGFDWANSLSLNTGIMDGYASISRILTQLILMPSDPDPTNLAVKLNPDLPSLGEALAVLSGCTLLKSMIDAPFVHFWNYTRPALDNYQTQYFNASLRAQQYASGGVDSASKGWILILLLVFLMNVGVLAYFLVHRGLVTDFCEPPNLFALAVNSPPSHVLAGSCGGGPEGKQYGVNWFVQHEGGHLYMEPGEKSDLQHDYGKPHVHVEEVESETPSLRQKSSNGFFTPIVSAFSRLTGQFGKKRAPARLQSGSAVERMRPVSVASNAGYEMEDGTTRTQRQYAKLANRRSML